MSASGAATAAAGAGDPSVVSVDGDPGGITSPGGAGRGPASCRRVSTTLNRAFMSVKTVELSGGYLVIGRRFRTGRGIGRLSRRVKSVGL
jgi:hypothetical protein